MEYYCAYCKESISSGRRLKAHCASLEHQVAATSDGERQWKYRNPSPHFFRASRCLQEMCTGRCTTSCENPHSEGELLEWTERLRYKKMKMKKNQELRSQENVYFEDLPVKYLISSDQQFTVRDIEGIVLSVNPEELSILAAESSSEREWTFSIRTKVHLNRITLLDGVDKMHFSLSHIERNPGGKEEKRIHFKDQCHCLSIRNNLRSDEEYEYTCKVKFMTSSPGPFSQFVAFDFFGTPTLIKKLKVVVISTTCFDNVTGIREIMMPLFERNRGISGTIIAFQRKKHLLSDAKDTLNYLYAPPENCSSLTHAVFEGLNRSNYVARQHQLLFVEEVARRELISKYNCTVEIRLRKCGRNSNRSQSDAYAQYHGTHFADVILPTNLSEEFDGATRLLSNCDKVLLASARTEAKEDRKIYEAYILRMGECDMLIRVSKSCVESLRLKFHAATEVELQFQFKSSMFCELHLAVDRLQPLSLVFPDVGVAPMSWKCMGINLKSLDSVLSFNQRQAVLTIAAPLSMRLPPILISGPFGTGKSFTLFEAAKILLRDSSNRLLICTRSNSAADEYITKYFHPYATESHEDIPLMRLYHYTQRVHSISSTVRKYCLIETRNNIPMFRMPKVEDLLKYRVVVSNLRTSRHLFETYMKKGFFTHIFIDNVAEARESEAIIPLGMATQCTRIVLAGDLMQPTARVFTAFARQCGFDRSLLHRLWILYPERFPCKFLLTENYSSHQTLVDFASRTYYRYPVSAKGRYPACQQFRPLTWIPLTEESDKNQKYQVFNIKLKDEVGTIVTQIEKLKNSWPEEWGPQHDANIAVLTPFRNQAIEITAALGRNHLDGVFCGKVSSVEGKHFHVIFLAGLNSSRPCCNVSKKLSCFNYDIDYGFLSEMNFLLLTAVTRAQFLVAVIGNPKTFGCSSEKCRHLWQNFFSVCQGYSEVDAEIPDSSFLTHVDLKADECRPVNSEFARDSSTLVSGTDNCIKEDFDSGSEDSCLHDSDSTFHSVEEFPVLGEILGRKFQFSSPCKSFSVDQEKTGVEVNDSASEVLTEDEDLCLRDSDSTFYSAEEFSVLDEILGSKFKCSAPCKSFPVCQEKRSVDVNDSASEIFTEDEDFCI